MQRPLLVCMWGAHVAGSAPREATLVTSQHVSVPFSSSLKLLLEVWMP